MKEIVSGAGLELVLVESPSGRMLPISERPGVRWEIRAEKSNAKIGVASTIEWDLPHRTTKVHPRVNRALKLIPERLEGSSEVSLKALADISGLSQSRFMHAFTQSVGMPLRRYILSLRLQRAISELMLGATVTAAACSAGFSDAAHLTRTFRQMLGVAPTDIFVRKGSQPHI